MKYVWISLSTAGIALQVLLVHRLTKGFFRRFPALTVYVLALFLTTVVEASAFYNPGIWAHTSRYYWTVDSIRQLLIFVVVISLTYEVMGDAPVRAALRRLLVVGAVIFTIGSLYATEEPRFGFWMAKVGRNLGFCAVLMNLILWAVLIRYRQADRLLLMISGGLGIQMAGKAIGHALRQLSDHVLSAVQITGDLVIVLSHLACLYIWWRAFSTFAPRSPQPVQ